MRLINADKLKKAIEYSRDFKIGYQRFQNWLS